MARRKAWMRLAMLYGMVEQIHSLELRAAAGQVDDVACAQAIEAAIHRSKLAGGRAALGSGDREQWQVAETVRGISEARIECLARLRVEREATLNQAAQTHRHSRTKMEQMKCVVERDQERMGVEEARRAQAESDDRFGSRRAWSEAAQLHRSR